MGAFCTNAGRQQQPQQPQQQQARHSSHEHTSRRALLLGTTSLAAWQLLQPHIAQADEVVAVEVEVEPRESASPAVSPPAQAPQRRSSSAQGFQLETDSLDKFSLQIPGSWVKAEGQIAGGGGFTAANGSRRTVAYFPADAKSPNDVNISVVISNVSFEFTKLGSFGNAASFASNLVNSLDRSYLLRTPAWARKGQDEPVQVARLIDYGNSREQYQVEYVIKKGDEPQRHLLSTVALGSNGRYNRLYTVTAQCRDEQLFEQYKDTLTRALESFVAEVKPQA